MATRIVYFDKGAVLSRYYTDQNYGLPGTVRYDSDGSRRYLLMRTTESVEDIQFRLLYSASVYLAAAEVYPNVWGTCTYVVPLEKAFDEGTVTDRTSPYVRTFGGDYFRVEHEEQTGYAGGRADEYLANLLLYGAGIEPDEIRLYTPGSEYPPYLSISYGDETVGLDISAAFPTTGAMISKALPTCFSWTAVANGPVVGCTPVVPQTTKFRWRYSGEESINEVALGGDTTYTMPAGTFDNGVIEWQVEVVSNSGVATTTDWETVDVADPVPSTQLVAPISAAIDGAQAVSFVWHHVIGNGTPQTKYELQISSDNLTWSTVASEETDRTSVEINADLLQAGDLYWRVRTFNSDGVSGEWSDPAHCIVIDAPSAPQVMIVSSAPVFEIRWQSESQQAYEIAVDGEVVLRRFGLDSSYKYSGWLIDGAHIIGVRVQNKFSLWSTWREISLSISNISAERISLYATPGNTVMLRWTADMEYEAFEVLRNGRRIGRTAECEFADHFASGLAEFQIVGLRADGHYAASNSLNVDASVGCMMIADVSNPIWISLDKSTSSLRETSGNTEKSVSYKRYIGREFPVAEIGEYSDSNFRFEVAWRACDASSIESFAALIGKQVCIKTPNGRCLVGIMNPVDRYDTCLITSFSAVLTLVDWKEM